LGDFVVAFKCNFYFSVPEEVCDFSDLWGYTSECRPLGGSPGEKKPLLQLTIDPHHLKKPVKQLPSYRTSSAMLPFSEPLPTKTTGHYTICCKNLSYNPEDGQKIARIMLS